jgi:hypothetical protein
MKYMIMMFGDAAAMGEVKSPEWIREMIGFMTSLDEELTANGEMVFNAGLGDSSTAKLVKRGDGPVPIVTDGPYAESKESIIGFWVVDVESEQRMIDISARIVQYSEVVEVRPVGEAPPEV